MRRIVLHLAPGLLLGLLAAGCENGLSYFEKYDLAQPVDPDLAGMMVQDDGGMVDGGVTDDMAVPDDMPMVMQDMAMMGMPDVAMMAMPDMAMMAKPDMAMMATPDMVMLPDLSPED